MRTVLVLASAIVNSIPLRASTASRTCSPAPNIPPLMESATEPIAAPPSALPEELRGPPPPRHGGALALLRFMRRRGMLNFKYGRLIVRLGVIKLRLRSRLRLDGLAFVGPGCSLEVGRR